MSETTTQAGYDWHVEVKRFYVSRETAVGSEPPAATPSKRQSVPVTLRVLHLFRPDDLPWSHLWARYARLFLVRRGGNVHYSLAVRKETRPPWWNENREPQVADEYTALRQMNRAEALTLLRHWIGDSAERALETMETMPPPKRVR